MYNAHTISQNFDIYLLVIWLIHCDAFHCLCFLCCCQNKINQCLLPFQTVPLFLTDEPMLDTWMSELWFQVLFPRHNTACLSPVLLWKCPTELCYDTICKIITNISGSITIHQAKLHVSVYIFKCFIQLLKTSHPINSPKSHKEILICKISLSPKRSRTMQWYPKDSISTIHLTDVTPLLGIFFWESNINVSLG